MEKLALTASAPAFGPLCDAINAAVDSGTRAGYGGYFAMMRMAEVVDRWECACDVEDDELDELPHEHRAYMDPLTVAAAAAMVAAELRGAPVAVLNEDEREFYRSMVDAIRRALSGQELVEAAEYLEQVGAQVRSAVEAAGTAA